jgi:5-methylcytosine-specific restriction protein A
MKLTTLKPRLQSGGGRVTVHAPPRPGTEQRLRGWAGVQDRKRIRQRDGGECQACRRAGKFALGGPVDHIVPLWEGGADTDDNKELLCVPCHDAKTALEAARRAGGA